MIKFFALTLLFSMWCSGCADKRKLHQKNVLLETRDSEPPESKEVIALAKNSEPQTGLVNVEIKLDPKHPQNEDFRSDWYVGVYNVDDHARPLGPTYFAGTDYSGKATIVVPYVMLGMPMVVTARNQAHPLAPPGTLEMGHEITLRAFVPANCHIMPIMVDQLTNAAWVYYFRFFAQQGAENWNPSQVDCALWAKYSLALLKTHEIQDILSDIPDTRTKMISLLDLIPPLQHYPQFIYKTRPPIFFAEQRHNGGGLDDGKLLRPHALQDDEERFIGQCENAKIPDEFYAGNQLENLRSRNSVTVNEKGLLRSLCGIEHHDNLQPMRLRPKLIVNDRDIKKADEQYTLDDKNFNGHISYYRNDKNTLHDLNIRMASVRHTNGLPKDSDDFEEVCSVTIMTDFINTSDSNEDIKTGSGLLFRDLFDHDDDQPSAAFDDAAIWYTSSGNRVVDNEDTWAILFDKSPIVDHGLLHACGSQLFCDHPYPVPLCEPFDRFSPRYDMVQFFKLHPNFFPHVIEEAFVVELLGFRKGDYRDNLHMVFNDDEEDLFIGLLADYELRPAQTDGEQANFATTITYLNKQNMRPTLRACYQSADYLARQQIDVLLLNKEIPVVVAANMIAESRCFSNSAANQQWQDYRLGLFSMNGHKQVRPNLFIPSGWLGPDLTYELYLKKYDEAVFVGPIGYFHTQFFIGAVAEIPTATEGDEVMFVAQDACCNTFKVSMPAAPELTDLYPALGQKMLVDTTGLDNSVLGLPPPSKMQALIP